MRHLQSVFVRRAVPRAEAYADERLDPLWAGLLEGFVEKDGRHAR